MWLALNAAFLDRYGELISVLILHSITVTFGLSAATSTLRQKVAVLTGNGEEGSETNFAD